MDSRAGHWRSAVPAIGASARVPGGASVGDVAIDGRRPAGDASIVDSDAEAAARRAVEAYSDLILRLGYTYLHSTHDAQDVCQDVLCKLLTRQGAFESAEHERAWVIRATANACKDLLKRAERRRTVGLEAAPDVPAPAPEPPDSPVLEAVARLPIEQREAIHLHYYEGYPIADVARLCGCSEDAAAKRLSRARATLRDILGGTK